MLIITKAFLYIYGLMPGKISSGYIREAVLYSALILIVTVSFLFSPAPKDESHYCGQYISLGSHAGFTFNCDAADYCMAAKNPSRIMGDSAVRQSRPLFILTVSALGHPLQWLCDKSGLSFFRRMGDEAAQYVGFYMAYIIINYLCLLFSMLLFASIIKRTGKMNILLLLALQVLLVSNEVTKAFFWTAHQQFFSLLTPLLTIWLGLYIRDRKYALKNIGIISFLLGILMLFYGNFITAFGAVLLLAFLTNRKLHFLHLIRNCVLFLLPTLLWMFICISKNGHYYNHEIAKYRQFVWITDTLAISFSAFISALASNISAFFKGFGQMAVFISLAMLSLIVTFRKFPVQYRPLRRAIVVTGIVSFFFFMLLGFYEERLTYTLLPVCLCAISLVALQIPQSWKTGALAFTLALTWHLYTLFSYGPFS